MFGEKQKTCVYIYIYIYIDNIYIYILYYGFDNLTRSSWRRDAVPIGLACLNLFEYWCDDGLETSTCKEILCNIHSDLYDCKVMSFSQQHAGKGTCNMVRYMCICFFCAHSTCAMVWTPVLFVDSREWSYCQFDTSSLWGLTSPSAHILFESRKVMPSLRHVELQHPCH